MITIDNMRLHLPANMQERAGIIAQLVAQQLSHFQEQISQECSGEIGQLNIGALHIHHSFSDVQIAQTIARAIGEKIQHQLTVKPFSGQDAAKAVSKGNQQSITQQTKVRSQGAIL